MMRFISLIVLFTWSLSACAEGPKYSREQCIVRMNIEWGNISPNDKEKMIRLITDSIRKASDMGFARDPGGSTIQGENREFIYYQYRDDCENRISNMERLLSRVREATSESLPMMSVDPRSFEPSVDTIRSSGPWWKDREKPVGKRVTIDGKEYIKVE